MLEFVFLFPLLIGVAAMVLPVRLSMLALVGAAMLHLLITLSAWLGHLTPWAPGYFSAAPEGMLILLITSFIFLLISIYTVSYLGETRMSNVPVFIGCMLLFLATMSMVALADHLIVLWVAIEATTLVSAPLIFLSRSDASLEATWKYVIVCSVGIALALLGSFFVALSMDLGQVHGQLTFQALYEVAPRLDPAWLKAGFIFIMIGYGTKMGLAPMHTWLPDAHSEAPSPASALLSGVLLNCAFLGVYKIHLLMHAAGMGAYSSNVLIAFGLLSMLVAVIFIHRQPDYKRMLAYSSIENMGVITLGVGIGGIAVYGALLHLIHHSLLKSSLFLSAGNILLGYGTKMANKIGNMPALMPKTFCAFFSGFAGISGFPPFGIFLSKLIIVLGAVAAARYYTLGIFVFCIILIFAEGAKIVMGMSFRPSQAEIRVQENVWRVLPSFVLLSTSIVLFFWMPDELILTLRNAVAMIGGGING